MKRFLNHDGRILEFLKESENDNLETLCLDDVLKDLIRLDEEMLDLKNFVQITMPLKIGIKYLFLHYNFKRKSETDRKIVWSFIADIVVETMTAKPHHNKSNRRSSKKKVSAEFSTLKSKVASLGKSSCRVRSNAKYMYEKMSQFDGLKGFDINVGDI